MLHFCCPLLCCFLSLAVQASHALPFVSNPTARPRLAARQRSQLQQLWSRPLGAVPEEVLQNGLKHEVFEARNWARLVNKLTTDGSTVNVVAFGGSVTVGYQRSNTTYPDELLAWLRNTFPRVNFSLFNLARRATAATFAALCLVQQMPPDADLVLIEYSVNGYGGECQCFSSAQTGGYEALLRKVISKAPSAALLAFASFDFRLDKDKQPSKYYDTGEDQHAVVCKRYGVPMMSVRDALYDAMFEPGNAHGIERTAVLVDNVHVSNYGAAVYAAFLAWALRHHAARVLLQQQHTQTAAVAAPAMPAPLNAEAAQEDWPAFCAEGAGIEQHVQDNKGWKFVDEGSRACPGCHKYGWVADAAGSSITVRVNSAVLDAIQDDKQQGVKVMLAITYLKSHAGVGQARVECVGGCQCQHKVFDGKNSRASSEMFTDRMEVGPAAACLIKVTVMEHSSTGGHRFKLASLAVHRQDRIMRYTYGPVHE